MKVEVERVAATGGSIAIGYGYEVESGDRIKFAGDTRMMAVIHEALEAEEVVEVELEGWEILGREARS